MISVRRAEIIDIPTIMQFLDEHWLHGYALAHDREFFDWQFVKNNKVNIWIGIDDKTNTLYAMQSAILYRDTPHPDMSGSVWIAIKSESPLLAFEVQDKLWAEMQPRDTFSPGLSSDAVRVNKLLGYPVVSMDHYYRLNNIEKYKIAIVKEKDIPYIQDSGYSLLPLDNVDEMKAIIPEETLIHSVPSKDYDYINWRYLSHPIFHYDLWKIQDNEGNSKAILITRTEKANGSSSCKIVDFYGDMQIFVHITTALDRLMAERKYEYIDVYSFGVPTDIYERAGFIRCSAHSSNIVPHYFQPYTPINADIFLVPPSTPGARLFRGDSDQDKPRLYDYHMSR